VFLESFQNVCGASLLRSGGGKQCFRHIGAMDMEQNVAALLCDTLSAAVRWRAGFSPSSRVYGSAPLGTEVHGAMLKPQRTMMHNHKMQFIMPFKFASQ
jgi:hypothetical protein